MAPRHIQVDSLDHLPPYGQPDSPPWSHPAPRRSLDWASILALGGVGIVTLLVCYWLFAADVRRYFAYGAGSWIPERMPAILLIVALLFVMKRWLLIQQPGGFQVFWFRVNEAETVRGILNVHQTHAATAFKQVAAYTLTESAAAPQITTTIEPQIIDAEAVPSGPKLIPDSEWMQWIDRTPHLLLSARTNAGKTTLAMAILAARAGEPLLILDPHDQPDKWFGLRAIGGGRNFDAILDALAGVLDEMDRRFKEYDQGARTDSFERLTVLIDETPALVAHTMDGTRTLDPRWKSFAKKLGSEARKVRISAILLTQSPLVQDIQISSYMRENFTRVALGDQVAGLLSEEKDTARRLELTELLRGREYAAAMEYKNEIHVLDTNNVPRLAQMPAGRAVMWRPTAYTPVVSAAATHSATVRASVAGAIVYPPRVVSSAGKIAWLLKSGYSYRQIERELSVSHATISQISRALKARRAQP